MARPSERRTLERQPANRSAARRQSAEEAMPSAPVPVKFTTAQTGLMLEPAAWRPVATFLPPPAPPRSDRPHATWRRNHQHLHDYPELMLALDGQVGYGLAGQVHPCSPGSLFLLDAREPHDNGYPPGTNPFLHLWLRVTPDSVFASLASGRTGGIEITSHWTRLIALAQTGVDFWRLLAESRAASTPQLAALRLKLAVGGILARLAEAEPADPPQESARFSAAVVEAVRRHIAETGGRDASLAELARLSGYSRYHFWRLFKRHAGMSVHEFVDCSRREKVVGGLRAGRSLKELGAELGFSCPAAFSRWFSQRRQEILAAAGDSRIAGATADDGHCR